MLHFFFHFLLRCKSSHFFLSFYYYFLKGQVEGHIVASSSLSQWQEYNNIQNWLSFSFVNGLIINGGGQINGQGSIWWYRLLYDVADSVRNRIYCDPIFLFLFIFSLICWKFLSNMKWEKITIFTFLFFQMRIVMPLNATVNLILKADE